MQRSFIYRWAWTATCFSFLICAGLSCAKARRIGPQTVLSGEEGSSILIAARQSEFKKNIIDKLEKNYRHRARLTVIDIDELNDVRTADYDALVVMGERMGWLMFSTKERRFLRHLEEPEKVILVMTSAIPDWKWDRDDIDVITGASKPENQDPIYRQVSERLDALLSKTVR